MVAVGTRIAPRPPRRSRRALLTHRAPPSGQTSAAKGRTHLRSDAPLPLGSTWLLGSASEQRPFVSCFPWVRPFPPRPPLEVAFHCSIASSVLWPHPTSHPRTHSAYGLSPSRAGPAHTSGHGWDLPGSDKERLHVHKVSDCARFISCEPFAMRRCCLLLLGTRSAPRT
jgi:hypothetical protein